MNLPYKVATLLYCFNERDEVLLMERAQRPNLGLWSPCGGKLHTEVGESPHACACREAWEEMGVKITPEELHLTGIISEQGYEGQSHWLLFLFEVKLKLTVTPEPHREGTFQFFSRDELASLKMPQTDVEQILAVLAVSGGIGADFSRSIAIVIPTGVTSGRWRNHERREALEA